MSLYSSEKPTFDKEEMQTRTVWNNDHPYKDIYPWSQKIPILWKRPVRRSPIIIRNRKISYPMKEVGKRPPIYPGIIQIPYPMKRQWDATYLSWNHFLDSLSYERGGERPPAIWLFIPESQLILSYEMRSLDRSPYLIRIPWFWSMKTNCYLPCPNES